VYRKKVVKPEPRSCGNCKHPCKITRYGPDYACGAHKFPEPEQCTLITPDGRCTAARNQEGILCKDVEFCTIRGRVTVGDTL
jgi:hypothetical protein